MILILHSALAAYKGLSSDIGHMIPCQSFCVNFKIKKLPTNIFVSGDHPIQMYSTESSTEAKINTSLFKKHRI